MIKAIYKSPTKQVIIEKEVPAEELISSNIEMKSRFEGDLNTIWAYRDERGFHQFLFLKQGTDLHQVTAVVNAFENRVTIQSSSTEDFIELYVEDTMTLAYLTNQLYQVGRSGVIPTGASQELNIFKYAVEMLSQQQ